MSQKTCNSKTFANLFLKTFVKFAKFLQIFARFCKVLLYFTCAVKNSNVLTGQRINTTIISISEQQGTGHKNSVYFKWANVALLVTCTCFLLLLRLFRVCRAVHMFAVKSQQKGFRLLRPNAT